MPWRTQRIAAVAGCFLLLAGCAAAQQGSRAVLRNRQGTAADQAQNASPSDGNADTLPHDVWGTYHFDHLNESIEIDREHGRITGYITRMGDAETDSDTPLTYFFDKASLAGSRIQFQTRVVHGVWYSFDGTIFRGDADAQTRDSDGYYVLHGTLYTHHPAAGDEKSADETVESRTVNFKSMGN